MPTDQMAHTFVSQILFILQQIDLHMSGVLKYFWPDIKSFCEMINFVDKG